MNPNLSPLFPRNNVRLKKIGGKVWNNFIKIDSAGSVGSRGGGGELPEMERELVFQYGGGGEISRNVSDRNLCVVRFC